MRHDQPSLSNSEDNHSEPDSEDISKRLQKPLSSTDTEENAEVAIEPAATVENKESSVKDSSIDWVDEVLEIDDSTMLPGKYVHFVNPQIDLFTIKLSLNNVEMEAVVDTGAASSLI